MNRENLALDPTRKRYLDLLKRSVLGETFFDQDLRIRYLRACLRGEASYDERVLYDIRRFRPEEVQLVAAEIEAGFPAADLDNLPFCYTMLGRKRLEHVERSVEAILAEKIRGDLVECGVWRGGSVVFMRGLLAAYEVRDRAVWAVDSFEGLPAPSAQPDIDHGLDLRRERFPSLAVDLETVRRAFEVHGLLDEQVRFLPGWFEDTLTSSPIEEIALLRADGDLYSSTKAVLDGLYDRVVSGGFVVVDDYFLPSCRQAVDEFIAARGITDPIEKIDFTGICWRKSP